MAQRPDTPLLDRVAFPSDLAQFSDSELSRVADELRAETISAVSETGGHLGAGLGVVELTVALHAVFDTPRDKIIWDVGHQCYPHKILTGRRDRIRTLRMAGGLSGFTKRKESPYDPFGAAHSSTSISAALGFTMARELHGKCAEGLGDAVAVIGDGSISAGMAYEAMNNAGHLGKRMFVILNDNEMSIAPPTGAMSSYLSRLYAEGPFEELKHAAKTAASLLPPPFREGAKRAKDLLKGLTVGGTLFEELGFSYIGPIDGHDMEQLLAVLRAVHARATGPVLIHTITKKGKGYAPAEGAADKGHARAKFDVITGEQKKSASNAPSYTKVFAKALMDEAARDEQICAITAAMPDGTGLNLFAERFPKRCFDVGIAEQHAVTFAAGLAAGGCKPFAAIYSTFLQRVTIRSCMTWQSSACPCASPSTGPGWSARTGRPMRGRSISPICRICPISWSWPPRTRRSWCTWSPPPPPSTTAPPPSAFHGGRGWAWTCPNAAFPSRSARAASCEIGRAHV